MSPLKCLILTVVHAGRLQLWPAKTRITLQDRLQTRHVPQICSQLAAAVDSPGGPDGGCHSVHGP